MKITVIGRHLDIGDSLRQYAEDNITEISAKYFVDPINASAIITKETRGFYTVDISIQLGSGVVLQAEETDDEVYVAFDMAIKTIGKRLSRYKDRLKDHHKREPVHEVVANYLEIDTHDEEGAEGGVEPTIIAETAFKIQTLAVADAVMLLELSQAPAMLFKNPSNNRLNMVYRRKDGHIGWVDPEYSDVVSAAHVAKAPAKKAAKKAPAKKAAAKKAPAKKAPAKKAVAKKAPAKKVAAKKAPAKKAVAKKKK